MMPVTDEQVAAQRALLRDDMDQHKVLYAQLDREMVRTGYSALVTGAFCQAVERRFARDDRAEVIRFVGDVRSRSEALAKELDPQVAERVIRVVLGDGSIADVDDVTAVGTQLVLLTAIVADEQLDEAALDAFLASARKLADQLMA